jgi:3-dehydroquinate synthase
MPRALRLKLDKAVDDSHDINIGTGITSEIARALAGIEPGSRRWVVVCDHNTRDVLGLDLAAGLESAGVAADVLAVPPGEASKSLAVLEDLLGRMLAAGHDRSSAVAAVGGGVVGDLAGFAAGCYMRGIPHVQVPTTLLAQIDSSVGGKVAVNIPGGKNFCGLFKQPESVWIDTASLESLPPAELANGLGEMVKYAFIAGPGFHEFLAANTEAVKRLDHEVMVRAVTRSCEIKAAVVAGDEKEAGGRMVLNYGHTVGHAFEAASGYAIPHGLAVAMGMRVISGIAREAGLLTGPERDDHDALLDAFDLAPAPPDLDPDLVMRHMKADKKAKAGRLRFVLPTGIGRVTITEDVDPELVRRQVAAYLQG